MPQTIVAAGPVVAASVGTTALITKIGAAAGTAIAPGIGTAVGFLVGLGVGWLVGELSDAGRDALMNS